MEKSEFGRGLVTCLVKFAEHKELLEQFLRDKILLPEAHQIHLWINGASDHLYEIEVPKGEEWDEIRIKVGELQDKGLEMGHGMSHWNSCTKEEVRDLFYLLHEIIVMIDKKLGLEPDIGNY